MEVCPTHLRPDKLVFQNVPQVIRLNQFDERLIHDAGPNHQKQKIDLFQSVVGFVLVILLYLLGQNDDQNFESVVVLRLHDEPLVLMDNQQLFVNVLYEHQSRQQ